MPNFLSYKLSRSENWKCNTLQMHLQKFGNCKFCKIVEINKFKSTNSRTLSTLNVSLTKIFIGFQFSHQIILQVITSISGNFQVTR